MPYEDFLTYQLAQGHAVKTVTWYRYQLERYLAWPDPRPMTDVARINAYLAASRQAGNAPATVAGRYRALRCWFAWQVRQGLLPANPLANVPPPKVPKKLPKQASLAEYEALLDSIDGNTWLDARDRLIVNVLFLCGLRRSEVANLKREDFLVEHILHVREGKGGRDRLVPVLPAVERALVEYVFVRPEVNTMAFLVAADGIGRALDRGLGSNAIYLLLRRRCQRAGFRMLNPHAFRHGLAMYLLNAGGDMSLVQKILGHAQISTTANHYAEWLTAGVLREYSERMHGVGR